MRICIWGAGAMGTSLGMGIVNTCGEFSCDFVARDPSHVSALKRGVRVEYPGKTLQIPLSALLPEEVTGQYDILFLAVKQRDTEALLPSLREHLKEDGALVTVQNGLPELTLAPAFGGRVYGAVLSWGAERTEHAIRVTSQGALHAAVGAFSKGERVEEIAALLRPFAEVETGDLMEFRFAKLAVNASFSTLSAISGLTFYQLARRYPKYVLPLIRETFAVAGAYGCKTLPMHGHDLFHVFGRWGRLLLPIAMRPYRETRSGMLKDITEGKRCDVDFVAGAVVRAGEQAGVDTPLMRAAAALVHDIENGTAELSPESLRLLPV